MPQMAPPQLASQRTSQIVMCLAYHGKAFMGWQYQPHGMSVQQCLEEALFVSTGHSVRVNSAGRTDSGVHAHHQVASCFLESYPPLHKLKRQLNGLCKPHLSIKEMVVMPTHFHPRHDAISKIYRYQLHTQSYPPVYAPDHCWWTPALDYKQMQQAAKCLEGEHDFNAFRASRCAAKSSIKTLHQLRIELGDWVDGNLHITLIGDGFLQHMARIIVGTLVQVGLGRFAAAALPRILASKDRTQAGPTAPPHGLHLVRVDYDVNQFPELTSFL